MFKSATENSKPPMTINLFCASIRKVEGSKKFKFTLLLTDKKYEFYSDSEKDLQSWIVTLKEICNSLIQSSIEGPKKPDATSNIEDAQLRNISQIPGNNICADCGLKAPEWISLNLGVFVCIECSGAHRNLGTHISKVRSCLYDLFEPEQMQFLQSMGNIKANEIWEYDIQPPYVKPTGTDSLDVKKKWIQDKYQDMKFIEPKRKEEIYELFEITPQSIPPITDLRHSFNDTTVFNNTPTRRMTIDSPSVARKKEKKKSSPEASPTMSLENQDVFGLRRNTWTNNTEFSSSSPHMARKDGSVMNSVSKENLMMTMEPHYGNTASPATVSRSTYQKYFKKVMAEIPKEKKKKRDKEDRT